MSVKIYDGMMIERDLTLADARLMAGKLRTRLDKLAESEQIGACARVALRQLDHAYFGLGGNAQDEPSRSALGAAFAMLRTERENDERGLRSFLPMGGQMCLFPLGNGRTLAMCFGAKIYKDAFAKLSKAREYGYWDNTDPLEDLPKGEWAQRARDWKKALGRDYELAPAEAGLTAEIVSAKYKTWWSPEPSQIVEALGDEEFIPCARSRRLALEALEARWVAAAEPKTGSEAYRTMESFKAWLEGEGAARFEALRALYESELPAIDEMTLRLPSEGVEELGAGSRARLEAAILADAAKPAVVDRTKRLSL